MIQKQELRIGNSVMYKGEVWKVEELSDTAAHISQHPLWVRGHYENLEPIPITEEALKDMGFEQDIFGDYANENIYELLLQIDLISCRISVNSDDRRVDFEGIHNLQNYIYTNYQTELSYEPK